MGNDVLTEPNDIKSSFHFEFLRCLLPEIVVPSYDSSFVVSCKIPDLDKILWGSILILIHPPRILSISDRAFSHLPTARIEFSCEEQTKCVDQIRFIFRMILDKMNKGGHIILSLVCFTNSTDYKAYPCRGRSNRPGASVCKTNPYARVRTYGAVVRFALHLVVCSTRKKRKDEALVRTSPSKRQQK
jgi:hypothetical protein